MDMIKNIFLAVVCKRCSYLLKIICQ